MVFFHYAPLIFPYIQLGWLASPLSSCIHLSWNSLRLSERCCDVWVVVRNVMLNWDWFWCSSKCYAKLRLILVPLPVLTNSHVLSHLFKLQDGSVKKKKIPYAWYLCEDQLLCKWMIFAWSTKFSHIFSMDSLWKQKVRIMHLKAL